MKRFVLFLSLLAFALVGCNKNDGLNPSAIEQSFKNQGGEVVVCHYSDDGSYNVLVLMDVQLRLYRVSLVNGQYYETLLKTY